MYECTCMCACIKAQVMCCQELIKKSIRSWAGVFAIGQAFASILTLVTDTFCIYKGKLTTKQKAKSYLKLKIVFNGMCYLW